MSEEISTTYCYYHPDVETTLRCNRCDKPICPKDAVLTDTGYRCKDCVRQQQRTFETAEWFDYIVIVLITGGLSFLGSLLIAVLPLGFLSIFISPAIGVGISEAARFAVKKRRSKRLFQLATGAALLGSLPILLINLVPIFFGGGLNIWGLIWQGYYTFTVTSTIAYRLSGIKIR